MIRLLKRIFCSHIYGDAIIDPFVDECGCHSASYVCEKCGHKVRKTF